MAPRIKTNACYGFMWFHQSLYLSVVCVLLKHISHTRICHQRKWRLKVLIFVKHDQVGDVEIQDSVNYGVQYIGTDILIMIVRSVCCYKIFRNCIFCKLQPQNSATMNKIYVIFSSLCYLQNFKSFRNLKYSISVYLYQNRFTLMELYYGNVIR